MKKLLLILLLIPFLSFSQQVLHAGEPDWYNGEPLILSNLKSTQPLSCPSNSTISTGYPLWTNYWAGYMIKINNISTCSVTINCFEARFQGTSGYRIYTKTGTFVGFELNAAAWGLVGTAANLTGISTVGPTPIPIAVNVIIPPGSSQSFYLTRTDNVIANRHLYVTGLGTAGTTIYASDANIQITEGSYIDPYFAFLNIGTRRPSLDVYYNMTCSILPLELLKFEALNEDQINKINWKVSTNDVDELSIERSVDGENWEVIKEYYALLNSSLENSFYDMDYENTINYYRLKYFDKGNFYYSKIMAVDNRISNKTPLKYTDILGREANKDSKGIILIHHSDGKTEKIINY